MIKHQKEKILKKRKNKLGYESVMLWKDKKGKEKLVHRLVAEAFLFNFNDDPFVNHIDANPSNNCKWNLEWCSAEYNVNYGLQHKRIEKILKKS